MCLNECVCRKRERLLVSCFFSYLNEYVANQFPSNPWLIPKIAFGGRDMIIDSARSYLLRWFSGWKINSQANLDSSIDISFYAHPHKYFCIIVTDMLQHILLKINDTFMGVDLCKLERAFSLKKIYHLKGVMGGFDMIYCQASNISRTLVSNKISNHSDVVEQALLQLHLHSRLTVTPGLTALGKDSCKMRRETYSIMMTSSNGNIFRVTGHLCTGPRWIPHTKASDAELWCFLWSASE